MSSGGTGQEAVRPQYRMDGAQCSEEAKLKGTLKIMSRTENKQWFYYECEHYPFKTRK